MVADPAWILQREIVAPFSVAIKAIEYFFQLFVTGKLCSEYIIQLANVSLVTLFL